MLPSIAVAQETPVPFWSESVELMANGVGSLRVTCVDAGQPLPSVMLA
jgi:hypothetical protein